MLSVVVKPDLLVNMHRQGRNDPLDPLDLSLHLRPGADLELYLVFDGLDVVCIHLGLLDSAHGPLDAAGVLDQLGECGLHLYFVVEFESGVEDHAVAVALLVLDFHVLRLQLVRVIAQVDIFGFFVQTGFSVDFGPSYVGYSARFEWFDEDEPKAVDVVALRPVESSQL